MRWLLIAIALVGCRGGGVSVSVEGHELLALGTEQAVVERAALEGMVGAVTTCGVVYLTAAQRRELEPFRLEGGTSWTLAGFPAPARTVLERALVAGVPSVSEVDTDVSPSWRRGTHTETDVRCYEPGGTVAHHVARVSLAEDEHALVPLSIAGREVLVLLVSED